TFTDADGKSNVRKPVEYFNLLIYGFYEFPDVTKTTIAPQLELGQSMPSNLLNYVQSQQDQSGNRILDAIVHESSAMGASFFLIDNNQIFNFQLFDFVALAVFAVFFL